MPGDRGAVGRDPPGAAGTAVTVHEARCPVNSGGGTRSAEVPSPPDPDAADAEQLDVFDPALQRDALARELRTGFAYLKKRGTPTAPEVRDSIVLPVLGHLGWDVGGESSLVHSGLETAAGAVDFALCHPPGEPKVLVKIGAIPERGEGAAAAHPFADCTLRAIQLAVSEDARTWRLCFPADRGTIRKREFARFEMDPEADALTALRRYLAFHAVRSGEAFRQAGRDYGRIRFPAEALGAWRRVLSGEGVVERFSREMEEATGVAPDREEAERFVSGQVGVIRWAADPPDPEPVRRVKVGDRVWIYDAGSREIVTRVVVVRDPDIGKAEVSRDSPYGVLLGAREGEGRELRLPGQEPRSVRIVLIGTRASGRAGTGRSAREPSEA